MDFFRGFARPKRKIGKPHTGLPISGSDEKKGCESAGKPFAVGATQLLPQKGRILRIGTLDPHRMK